jgi:hypothetical protein
MMNDEDQFWHLLQTMHANQLVMISNQRAMIGMLQTLTNMETKMTISLDALSAAVANNSTIEGSVVTLLQQLASQIAAIPPSNDPATQASLDALVATLSQNDTTLASAVVANTPAVTPPPAASSARR